MTAKTRQQLLAQIHAIKKAMNWTDDQYRDILFLATGQRSAKDMDGATLARLVASLAEGAPSPEPKQRQPNEWDWANKVAEDKQRSIWKIYKLVKLLGIEKGGQIAYAEGVAARQYGYERHLPMMTAKELNDLIGPLKRTLESKQNAKKDTR